MELCRCPAETSIPKSSSTPAGPQHSSRHQHRLNSLGRLLEIDSSNQDKSYIRTASRTSFQLVAGDPPAMSENSTACSEYNLSNFCYPEPDVSSVVGATDACGPFSQQVLSPSSRQANIMAQRTASMDDAISFEQPAMSFLSGLSEQSFPDRCCSLADEPHFASNVSEPMFSAGCVHGALQLDRTDSYLESQPSAASDADWSAAVQQSPGSPSACPADQSSRDAAATDNSMHCSRSMQQQPQPCTFAGTVLRSSNARTTGIASWSHLSGAHTMHIPSLQQQLAGRFTTARNSPDLPPKQLQQQLYTTGNNRSTLHAYSNNSSSSSVSSSGSSSSRPTQQISLKGCVNAPTCASSSGYGVGYPLTRPPLAPAMQQQQQQQHQYLLQHQQQQQLHVLEEELEQLHRLGRQLEHARAAAFPCSAAATLAEAAVAKHQAAVKHALAAKAALLTSSAYSVAPPTAAAAAAMLDRHMSMPVQQQQQQYWRHPPCRSASLAAVQVHSPPANAAAGTTSMSSDIGTQQQQQQQQHKLVRRCASGPLSEAAQGKLQQLMTVQKMHAALQDELLRLLPMA